MKWNCRRGKYLLRPDWSSLFHIERGVVGGGVGGMCVCWGSAALRWLHLYGKTSCRSSGCFLLCGPARRNLRFGKRASGGIRESSDSLVRGIFIRLKVPSQSSSHLMSSYRRRRRWWRCIDVLLHLSPQEQTLRSWIQIRKSSVDLAFCWLIVLGCTWLWN